ncbi:hypothetical protein BBK36DRAFT_140751 [Trichoderma citrinoviride]|uniref:Uncharacterized protein n=1 Tax=Trichoderma citrinoviride TaxID=58853 RepID=A0A2T4B5P8_9HYPO|nr:hypothetical protein BBK36DRAFT_140751 [Trichoderma citrinoviride]PTB64598.1 hypothetical protein BBK36DRAFT_140751 [Trichoderma citrinoviride]
MSSTSPRDPTRLRHALHPLSTSSLAGYGNQLVSPISAVSMASSHVQAIHTPGSAILPYNPQEWVASPAAMAATERPLSLVGSEAQASPPPPPPYTPRRNMQQQQPRPVTMAFDYAPAQVVATPPSRFSSLLGHRPSPEPPAATRSFPPPPGASGRGSSRERLFALASLGRRRDIESSSSPEPVHAASRRSVGPALFHAQDVASTSVFNVEAVPPASRRAASTGAIDTPTSARSRSTSQTRWEPGMPLPPPPPGPPPSSSRSQSVQGMDRNNVPIISPPTRRPPPSGVSSLGPVPPTPADWSSQQMQLPQPTPPMKARSPNLTIDTMSASNPAEPIEPPLNSSGSASGLNRAKAVRHDKTILQRRSESRTRHESRGSVDNAIQVQQIADIVVPANGNGLVRRLTLGKATPRSNGKAPMDQPLTGESSGQHDSRNSTPRAPDSATLLHREVATPPFSPTPAKAYRQGGVSQSGVPKSLPTPPPQTRSASGSVVGEASRLSSSTTASPSKEIVVSQTAAEFATGSIERFRSFAIKEASAATDADRVRLFSDFIVTESRIRRERYSSAIGAMGSEIFDLSRDLFRPMNSVRRESMTSQSVGDWTPESSEPNRSHRNSVSSLQQADDSSSSAPASASLPSSPGIKQPLNWGGTANYMPSLSPILSMSVSDNHENGSSRGRPPSRWWETDSNGDPNRSGFERSKRESKYMGVPKDQWIEEQTTPHYAPTSEQCSASEYPPEKTGWHDQGEVWTPQQSSTSVASTPSTATNRHGLLDVSRLVTMPPPYPRHHPAVNNSHPELASIRAAVRSLSELADIEGSKERFASSSLRRREDATKAAAERRQALRSNLQKEISLGNLGYADAAAIEADFNEQEKDKKKEVEKLEYEHFQNQVVLPLNDILMERISRATELFDDLARHLFDSSEIDADMPQEEGDDKPELLEKLTLLKWIFEQRESLHRAIYDLLSDRNARYRDVVLTPYRLSGNAEKLKSAEAFFREDAEKREYAFANEVLNRAREFRSVMEEAVARGIELQLSAFWDIAPPLCGLLDSIPMHLEGFGVQIPASEYEENPAYYDHPLQYLYSLLLHAEKSTYQFIEAHTNQLCLLHEVKEAVVNAKARVLATQLVEADGTPIRPEDRELRAKQMKEVENRRLTEDLKEKVRLVQDQWDSSLGAAMTAVKERTGEWLLQTGGWDETLEDNGVGVV